MNRLIPYSITYIITTLLYLLFKGSVVIDSIVLLIYVLATFFFVFTREAKIDPDEFEVVAEEPKLHYYQASRINLYGYMIVLSVIITSALFYIITTYYNFKIGASVLIVWLIMIVSAHFIGKYTSKRLIIDAISDYIALTVKADFETIRKSVSTMMQEKIEGKKEVEKWLKKNTELPENILEKFSEKYVEYIKEAFEGDELISDEVKELKKSH